MAKSKIKAKEKMNFLIISIVGSVKRKLEVVLVELQGLYIYIISDFFYFKLQDLRNSHNPPLLVEDTKE